MENKNSAIIFDKDGVIVETEKFHYQAYKIAIKKITGLDLPIDKYISYGVSRNHRDFLSDALDNNLKEEEYDQISEQRWIEYKDLTDKNLEPVSGIFDLIESLRDRYVLAVASSASQESIIHDLESIGLINANYNPFSVILSGESVERNKPYPDVYLEVLKNINLERKIPIFASDCIVIEDSANGIRSAQAAGMPCVFRENDFTSLESLCKIGIVPSCTIGDYLEFQNTTSFLIK